MGPIHALILLGVLFGSSCSSAEDSPDAARGDGGGSDDGGSVSDGGPAVDAPASDGGDASAPDGGSSSDAASRDAGFVDGSSADAGPPPGSPCALPGYEGWRCHTIRRFSPLHSAEFTIAVRFNLPSSVPAASVLWWLGNDGRGQFRTQNNAASIQDRLATADRIRSIEVEPIDDGGYWRAPAMGYRASAAVMVDAVGALRSMGVAAGSWLTHVGYSNGANIAAAALAHHRYDDLVGRLIFVSGGGLSDMTRECGRPDDWAYMSSESFRQLFDRWNGWTGETEQFCERGSSTAVPSYDSRSTLGSTGRRSYPSVSLNVIIGELDEFGPWFLHSNRLWYDAVDAGEMSKHVLEGVGHVAFGDGANPAPARLVELVYGMARLPPLTALEHKPAVVFSTSRDGSPETRFGVDQRVYGRTVSIGSAAQACLEGESNPGHCDTISGWGTMPNGDWSFVAGTWRASFVPRDLGITPGTYRGWWRDSTTQAHTDQVSFDVE